MKDARRRKARLRCRRTLSKQSPRKKDLRVPGQPGVEYVLLRGEPDCEREVDGCRSHQGIVLAVLPVQGRGEAAAVFGVGGGIWSAGSSDSGQEPRDGACVVVEAGEVSAEVGLLALYGGDV